MIISESLTEWEFNRRTRWYCMFLSAGWEIHADREEQSVYPAALLGEQKKPAGHGDIADGEEHQRDGDPDGVRPSNGV